jgi:hypothetical protein
MVYFKLEQDVAGEKYTTDSQKVKIIKISARSLAGRPQARLREIMDASDGSATWDEIALVKAWLNRPGSPQL